MVLIPASHEHVTLHGKWDFAGMIKLRVSRLGDYPRLPSRSNVIMRAGGGLESEEVRVSDENADFEDGMGP